MAGVVYEKNEIVEQIRIMLDMKLEKLENDIKESINELKVKVDDVALKQSAFSERLSNLESKMSITEQSRVSQGSRLGELDNKLTKLTVEIETKEKMQQEFKASTLNTKKSVADWVRWIPPLIVGIIAFIVSLVK